jgi:anti-anti-sigma factor
MLSEERRNNSDRRAKVIMSHDLFTLSALGEANIIELSLPLNLDAGQFDHLNETLGQLITTSPHNRWVVDLGRVEYGGSAMLGLLVNLRQRIKQHGGSLVLCRLSDQLQKTMSTCSLDRLFKTVGSREMAVKVES